MVLYVTSQLESPKDTISPNKWYQIQAHGGMRQDQNLFMQLKQGHVLGAHTSVHSIRQEHKTYINVISKRSNNMVLPMVLDQRRGSHGHTGPLGWRGANSSCRWPKIRDVLKFTKR